MIVVCNSCSARFRIADEKVGPRGSKVRCSRCRNVFVVHRPADPAAVPPGPVTPTSRPASTHVPPPLPGSPPVPPPLPGVGGAELALDEASGPSRRAGAGKGAFADPFAALGVPRPDDPFARAAPAAAPPPSGPAPGPDDPFAAALRPGASAGQEPFVVSEPGLAAPPSGPSLPVTDLSDLSDRGAAPPPEVAALAGAAPPPETEEPELVTRSQGLSLEERTPGPGASGLGAAPFQESDGRSPPEGAGPDGFDLAGPDPGYAAEAREPAPPPEEPAPAAPAPAPRAAPAAPSPEPRPAAPAAATRAPASGAGRSASRSRSLLVNALSLAVLLLVAVALFALGQGEAGERGSFPWRLLARGSTAPGSPVVARDVSNGVYETSRGVRLLFVRGRVLSRSAGPLGPVRVRAEILEGQKVVGRAEGLGGAVPTPEELQDVAGPEDEERLRARLASRAAAGLSPGESVPFLVTFVEYPPRLGDLTFRVVAEAAPAPRG